jgi:hypothetical protein
MAWSAVSIAFKSIAQSAPINQLQENIEVIRDRLFLCLLQYMPEVDGSASTPVYLGRCYLPADFDLVRFGAYLKYNGSNVVVTLDIGGQSAQITHDNATYTAKDNTLDVSSLGSGWFDITVTVENGYMKGLHVVAEPNGSVT